MEENNQISDRGFTLVEIMVVLVILGIVATFLYSKITGAGEKAKANLTDLKLQSICSSIDSFRLKYNTLPASLDELVRCSERTGADCLPEINDPEQLKDAWGNPFSFTLDSGGRSCRIKSLGADGRDGGESVNFDRYKDCP